MKAPATLETARGILVVACAMAVAAQFAPFRYNMRVYDLWKQVIGAVVWMIRVDGFSVRQILPMACFVAGSFCVAAAPWFVRVLHLSTPLRWIARALMAVSMMGFARWVLAMPSGSDGCGWLLLAMMLGLLGLLLVPGKE